MWRRRPRRISDYAAQALAAGKAVFLEKPLSVDVAAADAFARRHAADRVAVNFPSPLRSRSSGCESGSTEGAVAAPGGFQIEVGFAKWPRPWQEAAANWLAGPAEGGFTREVVSHFLFLTRRLLGPLGSAPRASTTTGTGTERLVEARIDAAGGKGRAARGRGRDRPGRHQQLDPARHRRDPAARLVDRRARAAGWELGAPTRTRCRTRRRGRSCFGGSSSRSPA